MFELRNEVAIVGVGTMNFGEMYRQRDEFRTDFDLGARAFADALEDSGLQKSEIDGLLLTRISDYPHMASILGMPQLRLINHYGVAGRFCGVTIQAAAMAIATGMAETVACIYGNNGRSVGDTYGGGEGASAVATYETVYGMTSPGAAVAQMYSRYMKQYDVPDGALAPLAINNRKNAMNNPLAVMRGELTYETYMGSRFIAEPLRLFDYCLINDGAVAIILTTAERARDLRKHPVLITSTACSTDLSDVYQSKDQFFASTWDTADRLYGPAGLGPSDMDVLEIYDNFTPTIFYSLEGFGFCEQGSAWEWVQDGRIEAGGEMPINTSGGHTSESYMQGWNFTAQLVRQLRHEAVNQVSDCNVGQYICVSPITTSHILSLA